jgi:hypothetical protein
MNDKEFTNLVLMLAERASTSAKFNEIITNMNNEWDSK